MRVGTPVSLEALTASIREDLEGVEHEIRRMLAVEQAPVQDLVEHIGRFSGKRLRPALTLLAGRMFGELTPAHRTVGAIVEIIHMATLVHDDILDESRMRRRVETVNERVGNETAVLLGDYLFATAFKEAAALEDRFPSRYLAEVVGVVCRGEILQIHHRHDFELSEATYFRIIEDKTAALYAAALRCGAYLSGAPEEQREALARFGMKMGSAFQVVDDILDLVGEEDRVGKSLGTDLEKEKMTLPLLRLLRRLPRPERDRLRGEITEGEAERVRETLRPLLQEHRAVDSARETARELVQAAFTELHNVPDTPERTLLRQSAEYVLSRDR